MTLSTSTYPTLGQSIEDVPLVPADLDALVASVEEDIPDFPRVYDGPDGVAPQLADNAAPVGEWEVKPTVEPETRPSVGTDASGPAEPATEPASEPSTSSTPSLPFMEPSDVPLPRVYRWGVEGSADFGSGYGVFVPHAAMDPLWDHWGFGAGYDLDKAKDTPIPVVYAAAAAAAAPTVAPHTTVYDSLVILPNRSTWSGQLAYSDPRYTAGQFTVFQAGGSTLGTTYDNNGATPGESIRADGSFTITAGYLHALNSGLGHQGQFVGNSNGTLGNGLPAAFDTLVTVANPAGEEATLHLQGSFLQQGVLATQQVGSGHAVGANVSVGIAEHLDTGGYALSSMSGAKVGAVQLFNSSGALLNSVVVVNANGGGGNLVTGLPVIQAAHDGSGNVYWEAQTQNTVTGDYTITAGELDSSGNVLVAGHTLVTGTAFSHGDSYGLRDGGTDGLADTASGGGHHYIPNSAVGTDGSVATVFSEISTNGANHDVQLLILNTDTSLRTLVTVATSAVAGAAGTLEWPSVAALSGGGYAVDWVAHNGVTNGNTLHQEFFNAAGVSQGAAVTVGTWTDTVGTFSMAALSNGGLAVAHENAGNVSISFYDSSNALLAGETVASLYQGAASTTIPSLVALQSNNFLPNGGLLVIEDNGQSYKVFSNTGVDLYEGNFTNGVSVPTTATWASATVTADETGVYLCGVDQAGGIEAFKLDLGTSLNGQAENLSLGGGNNFIYDTSLADTITCSSGTDTIVSSQGADTITLGSGQDTLVIAYTRLNDNTQATVSGFNENHGDKLIVGDPIGAGALDATTFRLTSGNGTDTADILVQVRQNGGDPWHTVADFKGMVTSDGVLNGSVQPITQAALNAEAAHLIADHTVSKS